MSSEKQFEFTKENIDLYLKEVAKEYRKQAGKKMPAELVLIGGASVLINYGFRNMTTDIDALILAASAMKEAINRIGDRYGLPNGWLNADFMNTDSYSVNLSQFSVYYKTYSNTVTIRTVAAEYLIAMKLRSGRQYKSDLSDILGVLAEHEKRGTPISMHPRVARMLASRFSPIPMITVEQFPIPASSRAALEISPVWYTDATYGLSSRSLTGSESMAITLFPEAASVRATALPK